MESKNLQIVQPGERTNAAGKPVGNVILLSISDSEYGLFRPHLDYVELPDHLVRQIHGGSLLGSGHGCSQNTIWTRM